MCDLVSMPDPPDICPPDILANPQHRKETRLELWCGQNFASCVVLLQWVPSVWMGPVLEDNPLNLTDDVQLQYVHLPICSLQNI